MAALEFCTVQVFWRLLAEQRLLPNTQYAVGLDQRSLATLNWFSSDVLKRLLDVSCYAVVLTRIRRHRFNFDSTAIRPLFDTHSTAVLLPFDDYIMTVNLSVVDCFTDAFIHYRSARLRVSGQCYVIVTLM